MTLFLEGKYYYFPFRGDTRSTRTVELFISFLVRGAVSVSDTDELEGDI